MSPAATLTRRAANETDLPFLLALRIAAMGPHMAAAGHHPTDAEQQARVLSRFDSAELLLVDGGPVGLLKLLRDPGCWRLQQIQLMPAFQGRGFGGALIAELLAEARAAGVDMELSVLTRNPARRLYERLGFAVVSQDEHGFNMRASA